MSDECSGEMNKKPLITNTENMLILPAVYFEANKILLPLIARQSCNSFDLSKPAFSLDPSTYTIYKLRHHLFPSR